LNRRLLSRGEKDEIFVRKKGEEIQIKRTT
jgi:hypothetical protein